MRNINRKARATERLPHIITDKKDEDDLIRVPYLILNREKILIDELQFEDKDRIE